MDTWVAIGLVLGVIGVGVSIYYGQRPPPGNGQPAPRSGYEVAVRTTNGMPIYDLPDGRHEIGDHHVIVEAVNLGDRPIAVTGWGVKLPGDRRVVVTRPVNWSTRLPHVLRPGEPPAQLVVLAEELRRLEREEGIPYEEMMPYVSLADGKEILANRHVPLA